MFSTKSPPDAPAAAPAATPMPTPATRPIASVAVGTLQVEEAVPFQVRSEVALSQAAFQQDQARVLHAAASTAGIRAFTLEDVVLDADSLLTCKDGALIGETALFARPEARHPFDDAGLPLPDDDGSDIILGYNPVHFRYLNWVTQCLPAIDWCLRARQDRPARLLLPPLAAWQEEFLHLLGYGRIPRVTLERGARYRVRRLHIAEFLFGVHYGSVSMSLRQTLDRIAAAVPPTGPTKPVIYIPGTYYFYGALSNEAELVALMSRAGAGVIVPTLTVAERINLMRNAQVVIGPHSHALTDIAFCRPRSLLWELMPRHCLDPSINRIAQSGGMDYLADVFPVDGPAAPGEWQVDMALVQQRLRQINDRLARLAASAPATVPPAVAPPAVPAPAVVPSVAAPAPPAQAAPSPVPASEASSPAAAPFLAREFESLGDGMVPWLGQPDQAGAPRGLLQLAWFDVPPEARLERLAAALEQGFEGLGAAGSVTVAPGSGEGQGGLLAHDTAYGLRFPTGLPEGAATPGHLAAEAGRRLSFLRHKLIDDMLSGRKVWVWHSAATTHPGQLQPLLRVLRRLGPNVLLWVSPTEVRQQAGTIDPLADDFLRGYILSVPGGEAGLASWRGVRAMAGRWLQARASDAADASLGPFAPIDPPADATSSPPAGKDAVAEDTLEDTLAEDRVAGDTVMELAAEALADMAGVTGPLVVGPSVTEADPSSGDVAAPEDQRAEPLAPPAPEPPSQPAANPAMEYPPRNPAPAEAPSLEAAAGEAAPGGTAPAEAAPVEAAIGEAVPVETVPVEAMPVKATARRPPPRSFLSRLLGRGG